MNNIIRPMNWADLATILDQEGMSISRLSPTHKAIASSLHKVARRIRETEAQRDKDGVDFEASLINSLDDGYGGSE